MKILFLSPGWPKGRLWGELGFKFPTLSLASLAAVTPQEWDVAFHDDAIRATNFDTDVDLIALTAMTAQATRAYQLADTFRSRGKT
ncbi:MAG: radical SAM protein, partial [Trichlorobacter sp.]|nr:radical SAM protein [Trichlorobacter sp.]